MKARLHFLIVLFLLTPFAPVAGEDLRWVPKGPAPIGGEMTTGRVSAIAVSSTDPKLYYVGGADGGVWKTTDGGQTWVPLTDFLPTTAIGALAVDPNNHQIVYAGSGEANFANHSRYGLGLYKSVDGGQTWEVFGGDTFGGRCFSRILIDPDDSDVLYASITHAGGLPAFEFTAAAARGHLNADGPLGVWKSTNGGRNWIQLADGVPTDLSATDLVMDPADPTTLYAAVGHIFGSAQNGVFKSTDRGDTWIKLGGGFPETNVGRISLALTPADPQRIYASVIQACDNTGSGGFTFGVFRSDDGGQTWFFKDPGSIHSTYGYYLNTIIASPDNQDLILTGGIQLWKSTDGGNTWASAQGSQHVDMHVLVYDASKRLLSGNDGGIYRSTDQGSSWQPLNTGLGIVQFYAGISVDPRNPDIIYGGTQDNGTLKRTGSGERNWTWIRGGDGGWTAVHPNTPSVVFSEYQGTGNLYRSENGGGSFTWSGAGINRNDPNCFLPPYNFDPINPVRMFYATNRFYQSSNSGFNWSAVSSDLTGGGGAAVRGFAVAPSDSNTIYAGTNDGRVLVSFDGGTSWELRLTGVPGWPRVMRQFAVHPDDSRTAYLAVSYFGVDQILRTRDAWSTFEALDHNLPDIPVNTVALDAGFNPAVIYLGTDRGVYRSTDDGRTWALFGVGLPHCAVNDIIVDSRNSRILAATQGRGIWEVVLSEKRKKTGDIRR